MPLLQVISSRSITGAVATRVEGPRLETSVLFRGRRNQSLP